MLLACSGGHTSLHKPSHFNAGTQRCASPKNLALNRRKNHEIRASKPSPSCCNHEFALQKSSNHTGFKPQELLARVLGLGIIFAACNVALGGSAALAAPLPPLPGTQRVQSGVEFEDDDDEALHLVKNLLRLCKLDDKVMSAEGLAAEVKTRGEKVSLAELLKTLEGLSDEEAGVRELKQRLGEISRRLKRNNYVRTLFQGEKKPYTRRFSPAPGLRERLRDARLERPASELKTWEQVFSYSREFLEQALKRQQEGAIETPEELRIAEELRSKGRKLWEEKLLPLAMNTDNEATGGELGTINLDTALRNHMQLAGQSEKLALSAIKQRIGSPELNAALAQSSPGPSTKPGSSSLKQEELRKRLLDDPGFESQYLEEKQEKLLAARDNVLEQTWYSEKKNRWEMSVRAGVYAVEKNLVHHVRLRQDNRVCYLALKGDNQEYALEVQEINSLLQDEGGFDAFRAMLRVHGVPASVARMWIPLSDWSAVQILKAPFVLLWNFFSGIWNSSFVSTGREIYIESLLSILGEFWIRIGRPVFSKAPHELKAFLTMELPRGAEFRQPTPFMKWEKESEERVENKGISLPWWVDIPLRGYVVGGPLLLLVLWVAKLLWLVVGPRPLPKSAHKKELERLKKQYKRMEPFLNQVTTNPIKRAFDNMKRIRRPEIPLKDFVGLETFREEIDEVVSFLRDPRAYKQLGARPPRGVFILGESGTGKTALARAIAAEARVPVVELQFYDLEGGGDWVGQKAANVRELFKTARQFAPIILFMDDFHHFVGKRGESGKHDTQEAESLINQFLVELDGFETQEGVVVLATTRYPEKIDEALRRPGRMDRTITLLPPNRSQREKILRLIAPKYLPSYVIEWIDWAEVAEKLEDFNYNDLESIPRYLQAGATQSRFNDAQELEAYLKILHVYNTIVPRWIRETPLLRSLDNKLLDWLDLRVTKEDFEIAVRYMDVFGRSKPGIELHTPMYKWTRSTKYPNAVWAAGRGLVALLLPNFDAVELLWLDEVSWEGIPWTRFRRRVEEGYAKTQTQTRSYLEKELVVCYGSLVADRMMMPLIDRTALSRPQLQEAEEIATSMVLEYGWALDDSPVIYRSEEGAMNIGIDQMQTLSDKVTKLHQLAHDRAFKILSRHRKILEIFVEHLVEHEYINTEFMEKTLKENNAVYEKEPFMLQETEFSLPQSTNGTGLH